MIQRAEETRKQTLQNIESGTTKELKEISEKISNAVKNGEFFIVLDKLSYTSRNQLEYLGYNIDSGSQYNEIYYKISWGKLYSDTLKSLEDKLNN